MSYFTDFAPHLGLADFFWMTMRLVCLGSSYLLLRPLIATTELLVRKQTSVLIVTLIFGLLGWLGGSWAFRGVTDLGFVNRKTSSAIWPQSATRRTFERN